MRFPCSFSPAGVGLSVAAAVFLADQASKIGLRQTWLPDPWSRITVLPVFNLVHAWNDGVSFSMLAGAGDLRRWGLVVAMLLIGGAVTVGLLRTRAWLVALGYGAVLGGALGNVLDRIVHGAVFDFLQFHLAGYYWPSFNLADSAIVTGVGVLLFDSLQHREKA